MGLPEIGLEAIFKNADFLSAMGEYVKAVQGGSKETEGAGKSMTRSLAELGGGIVVGAMAAVTAAISTVSAACIASIPAVLDWAESLDGIGDVLGTTSDESAALSVAIEGVGGNVDSITGQMAYMVKGLESVDGKEGNVAKTMKDLGIAFKDANGNMLSSTDILTNVADVVGNMPDGLEKSKAMMLLFGKSGKDMSDTMSALANGGLEDARKKAEALGLTLGDDVTDSAIQLGREWKTVQMAGKGLIITLGKELLPIIAPLAQRFSQLAVQAMPQLRVIITQVAQAVGAFVQKAVTMIPQVIATFQNIAAWFANNKPVIVGALAAIATAVGVWAYTTIAAAIPAIAAFITASAPLIGVLLLVAGVVAALGYAWENNFLGMRDTLTAFWESSVKPALEQLWTWLQINIPIALQTLSNFWQTVLLPAIMAVWAWIQTSLFPLLQTLWNWLATNVPLAIQTLVDIWSNVLWPALQDVWGWIQDNLVPLLQVLGELIGVVLQLAVQEMSRLWSETLQPALNDVWSFIQGSVVPVLQDLWSWFAEKIFPVIKEVAEFLGYHFVNALRGVEGMIRSLINYVKKLVEALKKLVIPKALTPGSPTPFEVGLRGVEDAVKQVTSALAPMQVNLNRAGSAAGASAPTPAAATTNNITNTFNMGGQTVNNGMDVVQLRAFILQTVRGAL